MPTRLENWRTWWQLKILWWRHSHTFLWAHKPLCRRFAGDVLRVGPLYICRSCSFAYLGLILGLVAIVASRPWLESAILPVFLGVATATIAGSLPRIYRRWGRTTRDLLRTGMGLSAALCAGLLLYGFWQVALAGAAVMWSAWKTYFAHRLRHKESACDGCNELGSGKICSGFAQQAAGIRCYEEEASELVSLNYVPRKR